MELDKNTKIHLGHFSDSKGNKSKVEMTETQWRVWGKLPLFFAGLFRGRMYSSVPSFKKFGRRENRRLCHLTKIAKEKSDGLSTNVSRAGPPLSTQHDQNRRGIRGHVHLPFEGHRVHQVAPEVRWPWERDGKISLWWRWGVEETRTHGQLLLGGEVTSVIRVTQVWAESFSDLLEPVPVTELCLWLDYHTHTWKTCQNYHDRKNKTDRREILKYCSAESEIIHYRPWSRAFHGLLCLEA